MQADADVHNFCPHAAIRVWSGYSIVDVLQEPSIFKNVARVSFVPFYFISINPLFEMEEMKINLVRFFKVSSETTDTNSNLAFTRRKRNRICVLTVEVRGFDSHSISKNILLHACRSPHIV